MNIKKTNLLTKMEVKMTKGQLLIWRSGFGCELCTYIEKGNQYHTHKVEMLTGVCQGSSISLPKNELIPTTKKIFERYNRFYY